MSTQEIDESEFFHQDFSTASEWETFNARLEETFHEWKLPYTKLEKDLQPNQLFTCTWITTKETITFANAEFEIIRYKAVLDEVSEAPTITDILPCQAFIDLMSTCNDFILSVASSEEMNNGNPQQGMVHPLARWYGLRDFVVVRPVKSIQNESQIRILLSSIHIAVADSNCEVPVFIQVLRKDQNVFLGVCEFRSTRVTFDVVHLSSVPPTCRYLSGILDMFKGKVPYTYLNPVTVGVRLTYALNKFTSRSYLGDKRFAFNEEDFTDDELEDEELIRTKIIPFGTSVDPVAKLILNTTWTNVAENCVIDSQSYSDFDPLLAPIWSIRAEFDPTPICYASECIAEYLHQSNSPVAITEYYHNLSYEGVGASAGINPLDRITESKIPTITSVLPIPGVSMTKSGSGKDLEGTKEDVKRFEGPISDDNVMSMLYYLFPDAQPKEPINLYKLPECEAWDPMKIKSAPKDSLVQRLSLLMSVANAHLGGKKAMAQLWAEFAQEMRYRVEKGVQIPGVASGFPDSRTCLLHQKLQMLNICMERRRIREGGLPFAMTSSGSVQTRAEFKDAQNDSDEEFFDCNEADDESKSDAKHAAWNQPTGRLSKLGKMLLVDSDEPLYIPITQEPVPKTEDQLEDDAEVMLKLGPGSELRAQMMSASLFSDMESFKAANPAGKLEDFIRWYSPRDWIEDETCDEKDPFSRKGKLSPRMLIPGNMWQTTWDQAKPVPARRQRRLFDDTKEAEKVLHFFESMTIGLMIQMTVSSLFHAVIDKLQEEVGELADAIPNWDATVKKVIQTCCKLSREEWNSPNARGTSKEKWTSLLNDIINLEYSISQARSLKMKIAPDCIQLNEEQKTVLASLIKTFETELSNGAKNQISAHVLSMFTDARLAQSEQTGSTGTEDTGRDFILPSPCEKQFVLRVCGKMVQKGIGGPQFLRAIIKNDEFRLCGAFSQDTTFY